MKIQFRTVALTLALGLFGALTTAWAAESIINMISQGESAISALKSSKATYEQGLKQNKALAAQGKQLEQSQKDLAAAIDAYNKQTAAVKAEIAAYTAKCANKKLKKKEYDECTAEQKKVAADVAAVNALPAKLNKQKDAFNASVNKYNTDTKELQANAPKYQKAYDAALTTDEAWLNKVRNFTASPAVQPYAKKAHCPDTNKIAKNVGQVIDQSEAYLACLKKISGTG